MTSRRAWVGILVAVVVPLGTAPASAAAYFAYRDARTGCDVIVERADQIPRSSRDLARPLGPREADEQRAAAAACARQAAALVVAPDVAGPGRTGAIDASLSRRAGPSLSERELAELKLLCSPRVSAYVLALLAALAAWIAVIVAALREDHLGWAMLMLVLSAPVAFVYLFIGVGKDRGRFKAMCALGMISPVLVFLASVWQLLPPATR